jgi:hypothetical protein
MHSRFIIILFYYGNFRVIKYVRMELLLRSFPVIYFPMLMKVFYFLNWEKLSLYSHSKFVQIKCFYNPQINDFT